MFFNFIGWALLAVLIALGVKVFIQRRMLNSGEMKRCHYCGRPYKDEVIYCPNCGEMVKHGSYRR